MISSLPPDAVYVFIVFLTYIVLLLLNYIFNPLKSHGFSIFILFIVYTLTIIFKPFY